MFDSTNYSDLDAFYMIDYIVDYAKMFRYDIIPYTYENF